MISRLALPARGFITVAGGRTTATAGCPANCDFRCVAIGTADIAERTVRPGTVVLVSGALVTAPARFDPHDDQDTPDRTVCWQMLRIS